MQSRLPEILSLEYSRAPALLTKKQLLPSCHVKFVHDLVDRQMIWHAWGDATDGIGAKAVRPITSYRVK